MMSNIVKFIFNFLKLEQGFLNNFFLFKIDLGRKLHPNLVTKRFIVLKKIGVHIFMKFPFALALSINNHCRRVKSLIHFDKLSI